VSRYMQDRSTKSSRGIKGSLGIVHLVRNNSSTIFPTGGFFASHAKTVGRAIRFEGQRTDPLLSFEAPPDVQMRVRKEVVVFHTLRNVNGGAWSTTAGE